MKIFTGLAHPQLAAEVAALLSVPLSPVTITRFLDGEINVQLQEGVRGEDVFIIQPTCFPVNDNMMELAILIDAVRRGSARRITVVLPYFGYSRQDRQMGPGTPITAKLVADMLTAAGADRILTLDLHTRQVQGFFNIPLDNLSARRVFQAYYDAHLKGTLCNPLIVSPDIGGVKRARSLAESLCLDLVIIDKRRAMDGMAYVMNVIGDVAGRDCIVFDDIIDSGGTLVHCAAALKDHGAGDIIGFATHGVLSGTAKSRLQASPFKKIILTNSIPLRPSPKEKLEEFPKICKISIARALSDGIKGINREKNIIDLVD